MATWSSLSFQDEMSPIMEQLMIFHDHATTIMFFIMMTLMFIMTSMSLNKYTNRFLIEGEVIETIWTITPGIALIFIAFFSLRLLYLLEETINSSVTMKAIGHQWYWKYKYLDFNNLEFDSYMTSLNELPNNQFRLLDVDNWIVLPFKLQIRVLMSATDMIHSWTILSLGVKIDATSGRLNQLNTLMSCSGLFYGQCSEICEANHSFMPIVLESVPINSFMNWIIKMQN